MILRKMMLVIQLKNLTIAQNMIRLKKRKIPELGKYVTTRI